MLEWAIRPYITSMFSCSFRNTRIHTQPSRALKGKYGWKWLPINQFKYVILLSGRLTSCMSLAHGWEIHEGTTHVILEGTIVAQWLFFWRKKYYHFCEKYFGKGIFWCKFPALLNYFFSNKRKFNFKIGQKN